MNRKILALAIPNIISNITIPLLGMVDMAIVGHLGDDALIGGIAIGTAVFNFIYWNLAFLRMGTSGLAAQAYGAHDFREIAASLVRALSVALAAAMALLILQRPAGRLTLMMMDGTPHTMRYAAEYFFARIWAAPATISLFAFQGWYIGMQNSRFPMYIAIVINLINIVFCLWFTLGLGWGIAGVAWGTVVAQYCGLLISAGLWLRYYRRFLRYIDLKESLKIKPMLGFFRINRDIFLRTACIVAVYTFFTSASSGMGDTLLAVNMLLMQLFTLFSYLMDGFAYAGESLAGRYVGARNPEMLRKCIRYLLAWSLVVAILYVGVYAFGWRTILSLFTDSTAILSGAGAYVEWLIVIPLIAFAPFMIDGILIGATRTAVMRNSVFVSTVGFFAAYYGLRGIAGNNALWFAFTAFLVMRGVLQYYMTNRLRII